jgi:hypothetical protein
VLARPTLEQDGETYRLRPMREGWYEPTGCVTEESLAKGVRQQLEGLARVDAIELPQRPFWMLVPEPEDPSSGLFASWGPPRLGEPFILLAQESLIPDLQLLKDENLVDWEGDLRPTIPGWVPWLPRCVRSLGRRVHRKRTALPRVTATCRSVP